MMSNWNYFWQGFGVAVGILAGIIINLLIGHFRQSSKERQKIANLKLELNLNIKKIDTWLEELNIFRNSVNGDCLGSNFSYFDLGRAVLITANELFASGVLYRIISYEQIEQLQSIAGDFSKESEDNLAGILQHTKQNFLEHNDDINTWVSQYKPAVVAYIDYWDKKFKDHKTALEQIVHDLK